MALVLRTKFPALKVVFAARSDREQHTQGIGELVSDLDDLQRLVDAVKRAAVPGISRPRLTS